jgi:hypothetical protein
MANPNDIPAPQEPQKAGCQQEPCCAFVDAAEAELRHMLEVAHANGFRSITAAITFAKNARPALIQAEAALDCNKDIWDADLDRVHPDIKAKRLALRAVQSVLRHNVRALAPATGSAGSQQGLVFE